MFSLISDKKIVGYTPVITTLMLDGANILQLHRMWSAHSALGQSVGGWVQVGIALWLWMNWYRVMARDSIAFKTIWVGIVFNAIVIGTVLHFGGKW